MKNTQKILLSFLFVVGTAFLTHYFFVQRIESKDKGDNRDVASFGERNSMSQIKWEQTLADDLATSTTTQTSVKPSWHDLLVYEYLSGQYDVVVKQGQIEKLKLQPAMNGVKFQTSEFVEKYGRKIKNFATYKLDSADKKNETVQFFDQQGASAGLIKIERNDDGLVQNITVQ